ncbi:bifunctional metallophosphatase/5'-nucleotidase [Halalkalibacillus sediminis]|uniref:Bifunctional metallophosphatase/5'-nucleotidase n=1 Tax=Halalkalibacillus sediminis TaxID=2018042 RepID=A0A2I0QUU9_9BACI|nr:bifunctional UDP-sugar hydrolase/5'-nucleotidase [Halalkalibacillus sediminis]PKR78088.1 bifunctional metallophosphatase/5'-nucleotidase [Halalkalibacillus sediminis]
MSETIHVLFTSDLHSHFDNWSKCIHDMNTQLNKIQQKNEYVLMLDNGDHVDRSHPISEATLGQGSVQLLNHAGFHAATLGNNEGITLPADSLYHLYDDANFDIVCANLSTIDRESPPWLKPFETYKTPNGTNIGVIGLTAPFQLFYEKLGWETSNPYEELDYWVPKMRETCDIVILLSHLGVNDDEAIAQKYDIDAIIGGHTHHLFEHGQEIEGTLLTAVGKHGFYYGSMRLEYNKNQGLIHRKEGYAHSISKQDDVETNRLLQTLQIESDHQLSEVVVDLPEAYPVDWFTETKLMKSFVQTLEDWTEADCAMLNSGVLLEGFKEGPVTKKHIHQSCPHPMNPCTMMMSGNEIIEAIRMLETERFIQFELKGLGFRGKKLGKMVYSNIELVYHDQTNFVEKIFINGKEVESDEKYKVATADTFSFSWLLPPISSVKEKHYYMPEFLRDVLAKCLGNIKGV